MKKTEILIIGAGPAGLGAAYRLSELGHKNWKIYECNNYPGGQSASFQDMQGFTWDIGGHVIFSRYPYFSKMLSNILKNDYYEHERKSYIWVQKHLIDYPFQNNVHQLPPKLFAECLNGMLDAGMKNQKPKNFEDWLNIKFGAGINRLFMKPFNRKMWKIPLKRMDWKWTGQSIAQPDVKMLIKQYAGENSCKTISGFNNSFIFPAKGGTGALWQKTASKIKNKLFLNKKAVAINIKKKQVIFQDNHAESYEKLVSTMPLDSFASIADPLPVNVRKAVKNLKHTSGLIIGLGIKGRIPLEFSWVYFASDKIPFFRASCYSSYSPFNTPSKNYFSVLTETALAKGETTDVNCLVKRTVKGLLDSRLLMPCHGRNIVSCFIRREEHFYPIPTAGRDESLDIIQGFLEKNGIYSRGRFGTWKYELSSMDQSFMLGKNAIDEIMLC